jgi:hypothetical protein
MAAFSPHSDAVRAADLMEREELLMEEAQQLDAASCRRRCEIEAELAEIHCLLQKLGLRNKNV